MIILLWLNLDLWGIVISKFIKMAQNDVNLASVLLKYFEGTNLKYKKWFKYLLYAIVPLIFIIGFAGYWFLYRKSETIIEINKAENESSNDNDVDLDFKIKAVEVFHKVKDNDGTKWHSYNELKKTITDWAK